MLSIIATHYSSISLEAQKLITVSIGKINQSRVTRTGTSLHRSLLVASVLHKARNVYLEEERERAARYPTALLHCPPSSPELTVTPICSQNNTPIISAVDGASANNSNTSDNDKENSLQCHEDEVATPEKGEENRLPLSEASTDSTSNNNNTLSSTTNTTTTVTAVTNTSTITSTTSNTLQPRKRRRVSDQETAAAISSILPKRLRSELREDSTFYTENTVTILPNLPEENKNSSSVTDSQSLLERLSHEAEEDSPRVPSDEGGNRTPPVSPTSSSSDESDSDGDDSATDTSTSSCEEMEVDQLTSLVSYFSFSQSQQNCISSLHKSSNGPHVVALTA